MRALYAVSIAIAALLLAGGDADAKRSRRPKAKTPTPATATEASPTEAPGDAGGEAPETPPPAPTGGARLAAGASAASAPDATSDRASNRISERAGGPSTAPAPAPPPPVEVAPAPGGPPPAPNGPVPVKGKWSPVMYGFVELDAVRDSTQSFQEPAGNGIVQRNETYAGSHGRAMFGIRNSRIGFRLSAPEFDGVKVSGQLEMDFLGNQPSNPPATTEVAFFSNPTFRARHYMVKIETAYVDLMFGQYWQLFGWQSYYHPAAVEIQGLPGQVFSRTPQARAGHAFKSDFVTVEAALSAARPPQRDAGVPDGQGGLRVMFSQRKALHTLGGAGTSVDPTGIGVSGVVRKFVLPELVAAPVATRSATGWGVSIDALLAIIPATMDDRGNGLTLTGSFVTGSGIADLYTGLNGGLGAPAYPAPMTGAALAAPVDAGLVSFDTTGALKTIDWSSYMVGLQYYAPPSGKLWLAVNYSHMSSKNITQFTAAPAGVFTKSDWLDGNLFFDLTPAVRFGAEYAYFRQTRGDGVNQHNHRVQFSSWFIF